MRICYKLAMPFDRLILYGIATAATVAILAAAHRLSRIYLQEYIRSYFFYLLVSSPLALLGKPFPVLIAGFIRLDGRQSDRFFLLFDRLLAKPLWILALFLIIKCISAWVGKKLSRPFIVGFVVFWGAVLLSAWILMIRFFQTSRFSAADRAFGTVFNYLDIVVPLLVFGYGIIASLESREKPGGPESGRSVGSALFPRPFFGC